MTQTKTLIAIVNARHRPEWRKAIRETWLPQVPRDRADAFFFVGRGEPLDDPEGVMELDCSDKYEHLPEKVRAVAQWALDHKFSYMVKLDDDVVLHPKGFLESGYDKFPYSGRSNRPESPYAIPYGFFYVLDKKSMEIVSKYDLPGDGSNDDEKHVAYNLSLHDIKLHDERRVFLHQFTMPNIDVSRRPLRAPNRPVPTMLWGPQQEPGTFAWCVHLCAEMDIKLNEHKKLFSLYGQK